MKEIILTTALLVLLAGCATVSPEAYDPPEKPYSTWHSPEWHMGVPWKGYYRCSPYTTCPEGSRYYWVTPKKMPRDKYHMRRETHNWGLFHEEPLEKMER